MKKAFTLAEALITLAIVGVIASLTLPSLHHNIQKQQVGPALAKAFTTLENANRLLLEKTGQRDIISVCKEDGYITCLVDNGILEGSPGNFGELQIYDFSYTDVTNTFNPNMDMQILKDGTTYYGHKEIIDDKIKVRRKYHPLSYIMYVDVNGHQKKPNSIGRDIFTFTVDGNGELYAYGSRAWADRMNKPTWEVHCNENTVSKMMEVNDLGDHCAGSVVDNNYKIIYKY